VNLKDGPLEHFPDDAWWILVTAINAITELVNVVFIKLQARDLLLSQQATAFDELVVSICGHIDINGPHTADQIAAIDKCNNYTFSRWSISNQNIINYLYDQGTFIEDTYNQLPIRSQIDVIHMIGLLIIHIVDGVLNIQAERDSINLSTIFHQFYPTSWLKSLDESLQKLCPCISIILSKYGARN